MHGNRSFPGKNSFNSSFSLTCLGHGDALPPDASGRGVQGFEKIEQDTGVMLAVGPAGEGSLVAGLFGEVGEVAIEKPGERTEPEDRAMEKRQALGKRVAPGNVGEFMGEDGVELGDVPIAPVGREEDRRAQ